MTPAEREAAVEAVDRAADALVVASRILYGMALSLRKMTTPGGAALLEQEWRRRLSRARSVLDAVWEFGAADDDFVFSDLIRNINDSEAARQRALDASR